MPQSQTRNSYESDAIKCELQPREDVEGGGMGSHFTFVSKFEIPVDLMLVWLLRNLSTPLHVLFKKFVEIDLSHVCFSVFIQWS